MPHARTVEVKLGDKTNEHFKLEKDSQNYGSIRVTSAPAGATIFLDGVNTGVLTPETLNDVEIGNHEVSVTLSGYNTPVALPVNVAGAKMANIHFNLKIKPRIVLS